MAIQPLLHPSPLQSRFVTVVSWLGILSGAGITFAAVTTIALDHAGIGLLAALAGGVMAMIAGAGLNQREEWARQGFIFVQAYGILAALIDVVRGPTIGALLGLAVGLAINGWIIAKLRSPEVRAEFDASE
jgi:hypothetical protein